MEETRILDTSKVSKTGLDLSALQLNRYAYDQVAPWYFVVRASSAMGLLSWRRTILVNEVRIRPDQGMDAVKALYVGVVMELETAQSILQTI